MFICVDGSGPFSGDEYRAEFANSYLAQIIRHNTQAFARRAMGPNMLGLRQVTPESLVDVIRRRYDEGSDDAADTTVFLGGYSRGAATVNRRILVVQALPGTIALVLTFLAA